MLYKYRDINNFRYFVDIILNNRLFASSYTDLNDPMEGHYRYITSNITDEAFKHINSEKKKLGICSLSQSPDIELMWSHYCDGHRGLVIGIEIEENKTTNYDIQPIIYNGLPNIFEGSTILGHYDLIAKKILTNKHEIWKYEKEVRVFVEGSRYVKVVVKEIILGQKMDTRTQSFITKLVTSINSNISVKRSTVYNL